MGLHLSEVGVVADVVALPVLVDVGVALEFAGELFGDAERLEDGATVGTATADVRDVPRARCLEEAVNDMGGDPDETARGGNQWRCPT